MIKLAEADQMIRATLAHGQSMALAPLAVAVLDLGGHLVALQRADGSEYLRPHVAIGKAWGALGLGHPSRVLGERAPQAPAFFVALSDMSGGRMVPVPGGVIIRDSQQQIIGAIGVSGDTSDNDEAAAIAGIEAVGLLPDYGQNAEWRRP